MFDRLKDAAGLFMALGGVAASIFGIVVLKGGSPVTPELYGPLVYAVPAWSWVVVQMVICFGSAISLWVGHRVASAMFSSLFCLLMVVFTCMAWQAGASGTIMVANAGAWALPLGLSVVFISWKG